MNNVVALNTRSMWRTLLVSQKFIDMMNDTQSYFHSSLSLQKKFNVLVPCYQDEDMSEYFRTSVEGYSSDSMLRVSVDSIQRFSTGEELVVCCNERVFLLSMTCALKTSFSMRYDTRGKIESVPDTCY